jgi:hypothetical protein
MKSVPFGIAGVAAATGLFIFLSTLHAQDDGAPPAAITHALAATVDYGNDVIFQPEKSGTDFGLLGVRPDQIVSVSVQFPPEYVGQPVSAGTLDGGAITLPEGGLVVDSNGMVTFQFQGGFLGACRVNVHLADDANFLQFWVVDVDCPDSNPLGLTGGY